MQQTASNATPTANSAHQPPDVAPATRDLTSSLTLPVLCA